MNLKIQLASFIMQHFIRVGQGEKKKRVKSYMPCVGPLIGYFTLHHTEE
jgi:hypothetical protein